MLGIVRDTGLPCFLPTYLPSYLLAAWKPPASAAARRVGSAPPSCDSACRRAALPSQPLRQQGERTRACTPADRPKTWAKEAGR